MPARDRLDRRRPERDRLRRARPAYGSPSTTRQALAPVPTMTKRNGETPTPAPKRASASAAARTSDSSDDARRRDRGRDVEAAPVDRVGARRPAVEVDELAEPDPDGEPPAAELGGERGAVARAPPPRRARPRRHLTRARGPARSPTSTTPAAIFVPPTSIPRATAPRPRGTVAVRSAAPPLYSLVSAARGGDPQPQRREREEALGGSDRHRRRRARSRSPRARRTGRRRTTDHADDVVRTTTRTRGSSPCSSS